MQVHLLFDQKKNAKQAKVYEYNFTNNYNENSATH